MNEQDPARDERIESAIRAALQAGPPPPGFSLRVEAQLNARRAERRPQAPWSALHYLSQLKTQTAPRIAMAAMLLMIIVAPLAWHLHRQAEIARGEAARRQVLLALHITGTQLRTVQQHTRSIKVDLFQGDSE